MERVSELIDYSLYFKNVPDNAHDVDSKIDDVSFAYDNGSILNDEGFCLDQTEHSSIWDLGISCPSQDADDVCQVHTTRQLLPTQVSVGSEPLSPLALPSILLK